MQNQQQQEGLTWGQKFNLAFLIATAHHRALLVPFRTGWGVDALAFPCLFAFLLILVWAIFSRDPCMYVYLSIWSLCQLTRRWEAVKLARKGRTHSWSDGYPKGLCIIFSEPTARKIEPLLMAGLGAVLYFFNQDHGFPQGLSYLYLLGMFTLPFVAWVQQTVWERRTQAMVNSRLENQAMIRLYRERVEEEE